ncbi:hypothetical protein [Archangium sp. Cb G35]|uniref:hypothetical protein n=1 Tax=Archangium sp. Cb G35 TaxID=1920190 RepID=UPI001161094E|nr:hypothetical protein [Archangium sp. Cb G35]
MSFDRFRTTLSSFDRYYDRFLQNNFGHRPYLITLTSGDSAIGTPMAGSIANPMDPNVAFNFQSSDNQMYRIPFRELASAEMLVNAWIRTLAPNTTAGGDVRILLTESDAQRILSSVTEVEKFTAFDLNNAVVPSAPADYYKFIELEGTDFQIRRIHAHPPIQVEIEIKK